MKRTPLKRKTPLTPKSLNSTNSTLRLVSQKQKPELARRSKLKKELIEEYGEVCMTCGIHPSFPPIALSHIIPLSRGGKTVKENVVLECQDCHERFEKKPELRDTDA